MIAGPPPGHIAGMIARRIFLFIAVLMLLVNDDEADPLQWSKDGGARAEDHRRRAETDSPPLLRPLPGCEAAVHHRHPPGEAPCKKLDHLRRERDLGKEHQRAPALFKAAGNPLQVDLGFAAGGHAVQEHLFSAALLKSGADLRKDPLLLFI